MTTYQEPKRTLDLLKRRGRSGGIKPIILRRGEKGQKISATITLDDAVFPLSGYAAKFCAVNAAGDYVIRVASIDNASAGLVSYTVTPDLTAVDGVAMLAYFEFTKSGETATSDTLPIIVLENTDISDQEAEPYLPIIDELIGQLEGQRLVAHAGKGVQRCLGTILRENLVQGTEQNGIQFHGISLLL